MIYFDRGFIYLLFFKRDKRASFFSAMKRTRDDVDPLIITLRERDARKVAEKKKLLEKLRPDPPMEHIAETVECLEALAMRLSTDDDGVVRIRLKIISEDGMMYFIPKELKGDKWWTSVCAWDYTRIIQSELDMGSLKEDDFEPRSIDQNNAVQNALITAWLNAHPDSTIKWGDLLIISITVNALEK
jgi:hypothetical protein